MKRTLTTLTLGLAIAAGSDVPGQEPPIKIAFIGDQGLGANAEAVLRLILAEGAEAVIHSGDFDYNDDPAAWEAQIDGILGENFPYFASVGNHDIREFFAPGGYQDRLEERMERLGIPWKGELGALSSHYYRGIFIVLTAPGVVFPLDLFGVNSTFIREELAADDSIWRITSWHKNMRRMQVGDKPDETGWGVYEAARRGGAIIATGHEHSYSRTHLLRSMRHQVVASTESTLALSRDDPATIDDEGRSFAFVSGIGGRGIRDQERCLPTTPPYGCRGEWASIYTSDQGADHGALFGTFNHDGDPNLASFYFKDIAGNVPDRFLARVGAAAVAGACPADLNGDRTVDLRDLLALFSFWGTAHAAADLNGDGRVGDADLRILQGSIGACP